MNVDKIYIISVFDQYARRESIAEELKSVGWYNYEFIDAVRGLDLPSIDEMVNNGTLSKTFIDPNGLLNRNIIACSQSHKNAQLKFLEDGHKSCLILEDDVRLSIAMYKNLASGLIRHIQEEVSRIDPKIFMWGLVGTGIPHYGSGIPGFNFVKEYKKYTPDWAAHAYQLNREGAHAVIQNNSPIKFAADVNLEATGLKIHCTGMTLLEQTSGITSRYIADNVQHLVEAKTKDIIFTGAFYSSTLEDRGMYSFNGNSMNDIYFSDDRNISYEKIKFECNIEKAVIFKSIEFKDFIDPNGFVAKDWCFINF